MQKKLLAVAVAGALALPGVALAQSVTMTGFLKMGLGSIKIDEPNPAAPTISATGTVGGGRAGLHDSEYRLVDNSSRIIFNMNEDLGSGLGALAQVDIRLSGDNGSIGATGNTYAGLQSKEAGRLTFGRHDLHYGKSPSDLPNKAGLLQLAAISLMDYMPNNSGTNVPIGRGTRTVNAARWDSPNWGGFDVTLAYSANASGPESDLNPVAATTPPNGSVRKGYATNIAAAFTGASFKVEYSNWNEKPDGSLADNTGNVINAWYRMGGLKFGMAYHMKSVKNTAGTIKTEANAWTIPVNFSTGAHDFHFHYTVAEQAKVDGNKWDESGANMIALSYVYNLSKRTTVGLNYGKIENDKNVGYQFFTDTGGDLSSGNAALKTGEDATIMAMTFRHAF